MRAPTSGCSPTNSPQDISELEGLLAQQAEDPELRSYLGKSLHALAGDWREKIRHSGEKPIEYNTRAINPHLLGQTQDWERMTSMSEVDTSTSIAIEPI